MQYSYYHPDGIWHSMEPEKSDVILTFLPLFNTLICFIFMIHGWKIKEPRHATFFKPKKPLK